MSITKNSIPLIPGFLLCGFLIFPGSLQAANVFFENAIGDWAVDTNWRNNTPPVAGDTAFIQRNPSGGGSPTIAYLTSDPLGGNTIGVSVRQGGELHIQDNGFLRTTVDLSVAADSILRLEGGQLFTGTSGGNLLRVSGSETLAGGQAIFSGGSFTGGFVIGETTVTNTNRAVLEIQGDGTTFLGGSSVPQAFRQNATLRYTFSDTGISTLDQTIGTSMGFDSGARIEVNTLAYTGSEQSFVLYQTTSSNLNNIFANVDFFLNGVEIVDPSTVFDLDTTSAIRTLSLNVIPEPSAASLLGISVAAWLLHRRKAGKNN